jgi:hypothetical protein
MDRKPFEPSASKDVDIIRCDFTLSEIALFVVIFLLAGLCLGRTSARVWPLQPLEQVEQISRDTRRLGNL